MARPLREQIVQAYAKGFRVGAAYHELLPHQLVVFSLGHLRNNGALYVGIAEDGELSL